MPDIGASGHRALPHPDRARQFVPFAALKGYYELLRQQELVREPRHALTEDEAHSLSRRLAVLEDGSAVRVVHYKDNRYASSSGKITAIDRANRIIAVDGTRIAFDDIRMLEPLDDDDGATVR